MAILKFGFQGENRYHKIPGLNDKDLNISASISTVADHHNLPPPFFMCGGHQNPNPGTMPFLFSGLWV